MPVLCLAPSPTPSGKPESCLGADASIKSRSANSFAGKVLLVGVACDEFVEEHLANLVAATIAGPGKLIGLHIERGKGTRGRFASVIQTSSLARGW
jgi:hypothetical protein